MFGKASITPSRTSESWIIPFDALLDSDAQHGYVFITEDNKSAKKVKVILGSISRDHVQITSGLEKQSH